MDITTTTSNEVLQENHYYPFGLGTNGVWMNSATSLDNLYQYNGKELNNDWGLNMIDYGARMYMADLGRWGGVDALAEKYAGWSGYNYVLGNPVVFMDPDGREIWIAYGDNQRVRYDNGNLYNEDGSSYDGDDAFVGQVFSHLNRIGEAKAGQQVLSELTGSDDIFNILNVGTRHGGMEYRDTESGGNIAAGFLMQSGLATDESLNEANRIDALSNELLHGFQSIHGEGGAADLNKEFASDLFSRAVLQDLGYDEYLSITQSQWGNPSTQKGQQLNQNMATLLSAPNFDPELYRETVKLFPKAGPRGAFYKSRGIPTKVGKNGVAISRLFPLTNQ
ncbi:MAG: RHS repeat-associated core domain-containing protein [Bacteroidia bacterium]|nr:RHS repeat-associated core domain-containing protein [Bacteroidia bacterium]